MIEFRQVTKRYGGFTAVEELTFQVPAGGVVGLLGQNGAGKTTTLNMLTGYFPPTSGQVLVGGVDMLSEPRECKRLIGYLPEVPPLYDEMTVREYLTFAARLREVQERAIPAHIDEITELCGLTEVRNKRLVSLSKGYRQRVGIGQALCGEPPVIVLDEPTIGLDPVQVVEIRGLMRRLGEKHTVIFSSHILSEVQQLCDRVMILHKGHLARECDMSQVTGENGAMRLEATIAAPAEKLLSRLRALPSVRRAEVLSAAEPCRVMLECDSGSDAPQRQLFHLLAAVDAPLLELKCVHDTLEDFFLRLTTGQNDA